MTAAIATAAQRKLENKRRSRDADAPSDEAHVGVETPTTEDALALAFVEAHGARYRWTPGIDWMRNEGTHWVRDEELTRYDRARRICRAAAAEAPAGERKRLASAKTVGGVISLVQSDPRVALPTTAWDADPMLLNTPIGAVDLRTGATVSRDGRHFTQITRVSPDSTLQCGAWHMFLDAVFVGDELLIEFVQRLMGYSLTADRSEQMLFVFYGAGANGKSTLVDMMQWLMGTYAIKLPATALMQSRIERHPTELAQLRGKRLAVSSELEEGHFWAESRIKELTGDELLSARFMRQDFFEFRMTQKHLVVGNYKPRLRGGDAALARRFVLVPFQAKFEGPQRDRAMLDKLKAEAPAVLAWMVQGAMKWADSGLCIPASVSAASAEYMADNDDVALWMLECCERDPAARAKASALYESFSVWMRSRGQQLPSMRLWGDRMAVSPGIAKVVSNGVRYVGVRLSIDEQNRQLNEPVGAVRR